jgi:hypothetical protein
VAQGSSDGREGSRFHSRASKASNARNAALAVAATIAFASAPAMADVTKEQCIDANGKAQDLRRSGKLAAAGEQLRVCAAPSCPAMVRDDCTKRLDELDRAQPTIVFDAKDGAGNDVGQVRVTMDGAVLAAKLDGAALAVDPGEHTFTFEAPGKPAVTKTFILKEAEKARRERIVLGGVAQAAASAPIGPPSPAAAAAAPSPARAPVAAASTPPAAQAPSEPAPSSAPAGGGGGRKTLGLVLGGAGVVGVAVGSVFGLLASSSWNNAKNMCSAGSCPGSTRGQAQSDHDTAVTDGTVSTIAFVAGAALVAGGVVLFATAPSSGSGDASSARLVVAPDVGRDRGGLWLQGWF